MAAFAHDGLQQNLNSGWEFLFNGKWYKTHAPFSIHTDLLAHGLIPDPFYGENSNELGWVDSVTWIYKRSFRPDERMKNKNTVELVFEGVDGYANIYFNGKEILRTDNMFRPWRADVRSLLRPHNIIEVVFRPAVLIADSLYRNYEIKDLPGGERVMCRKAQYHFGWDFAPRMVTCGLWSAVYLDAYDDFRMASAAVFTDSVSAGKAFLTARVVFESAQEMPVIVEVTTAAGLRLLYSEITIDKGQTVKRFPMVLENPRLWWCNGKGDPYLSDFVFTCTGGNGQTLRAFRKAGIRTVRLHREKDARGESFYFTINGMPVFMKGANYVPQDVFLNRVTDDRYRALLIAVKEAGMNMVRVWGGGIYEKDVFYSLCDSLGILVWQDFMFACGMYPFNDSFLESVKAEAAFQVQRLSGFACLALWCGNNEVSEGWHRWGWKQPYSEDEQQKIWKGYSVLFRQLLPDIVRRFSDSDYHETSPMYGRGDSLHVSYGDAHNWFVWHDGEPFSCFEKYVPRFMSEFGFQSLPDKATLEDAGLYGELNNPSLLHHQKHPRGFSIINNYMKNRFGSIPESLDKYIELSQQLQAEGIITGIRAHLKSKPYCMGTLFWQLNDCWPSVSWSAIDYYGRKKKLYRDVKSVFLNSD